MSNHHCTVVWTDYRFSSPKLCCFFPEALAIKSKTNAYMGQKFFIRFLEELKKPKSPFEINYITFIIHRLCRVCDRTSFSISKYVWLRTAIFLIKVYCLNVGKILLCYFIYFFIITCITLVIMFPRYSTADHWYKNL